MMKFATQYNDTMAKRRHKFVSVPEGESLTQQSDAEDADINVIMARYERTGMMPDTGIKALQGDFSGGADFRSLQDKLREARDLFMEVPAKIRARFGNDPAEFIDFVQDPDNADELVKMGLANAEKKDENPLNAESPRYNPQKRYDDDGEHTDSDERPRYRAEQPTGGSQQRPGEGRSALREPQGVQPHGSGEPGRGGSSGGRR